MRLSRGRRDFPSPSSYFFHARQSDFDSLITSRVQDFRKKCQSCRRSPTLFVPPQRRRSDL